MLSRWAAAAILLFPAAALAQQPAPPPPAAAPAQQQPSNEWEKLPRMQLERQFAGPLRDTVIQRWRDAADGTVCYIYLPISAQHSAPGPAGFVQYGANTIGSISCLPGSPPRANSGGQPKAKQ